LDIINNCVKIGEKVEVKLGTKIGFQGFSFRYRCICGEFHKWREVFYGGFKCKSCGKNLEKVVEWVHGIHEDGVIIEDNVWLGASTVIDRGMGKDTKIGEGTKINNFVHIGHNVEIGKKCLIGVGVIICGSNVIEDLVFIAPGVIIEPGHKIGKGSILGTGSIIREDIPPYTVVSLETKIKVLKKLK